MILIVEADAFTRVLLLETLREEGYAVAAVSDAASALAWLSRAGELPSFILLGFETGGMSAALFRARQRSDPRLLLIPVACLDARPGRVAAPDDVEVVDTCFGLDPLLAIVTKHCWQERRVVYDREVSQDTFDGITPRA